MINKNRNMLSEYIYSLYDKGLMRDYSDNHFIIRAMTGQLDILRDYGHLLDTCFVNPSIDFSSTFLINFSNKLKRCATVFPERNIEIFVKDQLAAGKINYNEATFFEALSEINILFYFCNFVGNIKSALYEPRQGSGNTNPEAQFVFNDNTTIHIEVKKANFSNSINRNKGINGAIKPNIALKEHTKQELEAFCATNKLQLIYPRISKIGDFIASAGSKFQHPQHPYHYNVLFINWTFTDFPECGVNEPVSLFMNTENGLFYNYEALPLIKNRNGLNIINKSDIDKVSAVVIYRDTLETLLSGDFRFHFRNKTFRYLINRKNNAIIDFKKLNASLGMNPCNDGLVSSWYPLDYSLTIEDCDVLLQRARSTILKNSMILNGCNEKYV